MNTPMYVVRRGKSPTWVVRWTRDKVRQSRHFRTEEEAWTFSRTIPPADPQLHARRGRRAMYATDGDRITVNVSIDERGCWNWQRYVHINEGYGYLTACGRRLLAHRFSYETFVGPIPEGLQIDHLCRNRACVNPEHLEPVTAHENVHRAPWHVAKINGAKTHCRHGHEFTEENTGRSGKYRYRYCKTCSRAASRRSHERRMFRAAGIAA